MPDCRQHNDEMLVPLWELKQQYAVLGCNSAIACTSMTSHKLTLYRSHLVNSVSENHRCWSWQPATHRGHKLAVLFVLTQVSRAVITFLCKALLNSTIVSPVLAIMFQTIAFSHVNTRRATGSWTQTWFLYNTGQCSVTSHQEFALQCVTPYRQPRFILQGVYLIVADNVIILHK